MSLLPRREAGRDIGAANELFNALYDRGYRRGGLWRSALFCPGGNGGATSYLDDPAHFGTSARALAEVGWPTFSPDGAGHIKMGNPLSQDRVNKGWLKSISLLGTKADAPIYCGASQGATAVLNASIPFKEKLLALSPSLYWTLDDVTGATDLSGNGRHGTATGAVIVGGTNDSPITGGLGSTEVSGLDVDVVKSTYNPFQNGAAQTFTGWMKRLDSGSNSPGEAIWTSDGSEHTDLLLGSASAAAEVTFFSDVSIVAQWATGWPNPFAPPASAPWVFWTLVVDDPNNFAALYIDGALVSSEPMPNPPYVPPNVGNIRLSAGALPGEHGTHARHSHFAVFDRALSATEIVRLYRAVSNTKPAAMVLTVPGIDLEYIYTNVGAPYTAQIDAAWAAYGGWPANRDHYNPINQLAMHAGLGIPKRFYYASNDPLVPVSKITDWLAIDPSASAYNMGAVGHSGVGVNNNDVLNFLESYL